MTKNEEKLCADIVEHYGFLAQTRILQEECAELIMAASKINRQYDDFKDGKITEGKYLNNFIEELADVRIMLEQMNQALKKYHECDYEYEIRRKLKRQKERMENERWKS
jgi:NTP pyrophosphatase (non-canonical NTP hydrolase)